MGGASSQAPGPWLRIGPGQHALPLAGCIQRRIAGLATTGTLLVLAASARGLVSPIYVGPITNPFGLSDIGAGAAPALVDIDGDGDLDLLAGRSDGKFVYFKNIGSCAAPQYDAPAVNPFGLGDVGSYSVPAFADIDADGDLDAFVTNSAGELKFFQNTGSATNPSFAPPVENPFGLTPVGRIALGDLDADGDLDVVSLAKVSASWSRCGEWEIQWFRNEGTPNSPAFREGKLRAYTRGCGWAAAVALADIDADGDLDLWCGDSEIRFAEAIGRPTELSPPEPVFAGRRPLHSTDEPPFGLEDVGDRPRPAFGDIDCDGDDDVLLGASSGRFYFFENAAQVPPPAPPDCPAVPASGCVAASKRADLRIKDVARDRLDHFDWEFAGRLAELPEELFGSPADGLTSYSLCVYDESGGSARLAFSVAIPARALCSGRPCWEQRKYPWWEKITFFDRCAPPFEHEHDGLRSVRLERFRDSLDISMYASGENVPLPGPVSTRRYFEQDRRVVTQLLRSDVRSAGTLCWEAKFSAPALRNGHERFRDRCRGKRC